MPNSSPISEITEKLYLGSYMASRDKDLILELNIKAVVSLGAARWIT